jgi:hypothetical protein
MRKPTFTPCHVEAMKVGDKGACFACGLRPRQVARVPLGVWMGTHRPDAVCICHVCLSRAMLELNWIPAADPHAEKRG